MVGPSVRQLFSVSPDVCISSRRALLRTQLRRFGESLFSFLDTSVVVLVGPKIFQGVNQLLRHSSDLGQFHFRVARIGFQSVIEVVSGRKHFAMQLPSGFASHKRLRAGL